MKYAFCFLAVLLCASCAVIYNKEQILDVNSIGIHNSSLRLDGYYYQELEVETYPYYRNQYNGYSQDSTKEFTQVRIVPRVLFPDGNAHSFGAFSGFQENSGFNFEYKCALFDNNTLESALDHFECYLNNLPEKYYNFMTKKSKIWGQGVFKTTGNEIVIQIFYNHMGDYYLYEERGDILNDSTFVLTTATDFHDGKSYAINKKYFFKQTDTLPVIESYINNHKKKFE